jgi:hypothetical protein
LHDAVADENVLVDHQDEFATAKTDRNIAPDIIQHLPSAFTRDLGMNCLGYLDM